jgi:peptide/nickel transport system substrate-binding protein
MGKGDPLSASRRFRQAEALWRGRPLADLEFEPFARLEVERLEELRLASVEERIEAELQLGRDAELVTELQALVGDYPLRERLRAQLMLALYRSGRQADALESYRMMRIHLADELALEPSPRLRALEQAMLRQDMELELPLPQTHSAGLATTVEIPGQPESAEAPVPEDAPPSRPLFRNVRLAVVAVAALLAAILVPLEVGGSARLSAPIDENGLVLVSTRSGARVAGVPLDVAPAEVASGFGSLWVSEPDANRVVRVDPTRRQVVATIDVGRGPGAIGCSAGDVWVVNSLDGTLARIDPGSNKVVQTIKVGSDPSAVAVSGASVWVASRGDGTVQPVALSTGRPEAPIATGNGPSALAAYRGTLWVANEDSGTISRLDTRTRALVDTIQVGDSPSAIAATQSGVWVLDQLDATITHVDPARDLVAATFPLTGAPAGLALTNHAVWVADEDSAALLKLEPGGDRVVQTVPVGGLPQSLTANGGLWLSIDAGGERHRGGTLRVIATNLDTIDPASSESNNSPPTQIPGLLNDGLVTLDHVAGPQGARLVPDLALSLPAPSDGGRRYSFQLRAGIRYSTGELVRASDVRHSFERLFELGSSGAAFYSAIVGAAACVQGRHCDLSQGIVANNRTNTVTFNLNRPDPAFLYKLTIAYADVLPASTPVRALRRPAPATGPYEIATYLPGRKLTLVRNPYFREWSAAAQPDGYPDRIIMRIIGPHPTRAAALVAHDKADFTWFVGGVPGPAREEFLLHHPGQAYINPSLVTGQLALNVHAAPFNDLSVRRALSYALNRAQIAKTDGGTVAARPTCQILPPGMPGYRRYCPYTGDRRANGRWHRPDLALARRLVAASGTAGMRVRVWDSPLPPFAVNEGRATVAALQQLGYRATLHLLPDNALYAYANNSRNHAQVVDGGVSADYPSAEDFFSNFTCREFVPGNSQATGDSSEFCDPAIDRSIARATTLQATDPVAANSAWARLDRRLTNLAVWLPTVTPTETDLVSSRVGNYQYNPVWGPLVDQLWVR